MDKLIKNQKGQSTIEFSLTLILLLAYVLFLFQLTMVFSFGSYVHYATFMSGRALLAASSSPSDQRERARSVIVRMLKKSEGQAGLDKFPSIAQGLGGGEVLGLNLDPPSQYRPNDLNFSWMQGVRYTFKSRLFMLPLAGLLSQEASKYNSITLTSESWLGREPSDVECRNDMGSQRWFFDNGC